MESQVHLFRVFIASPSDLGDERRAAREVVEELNSIFSKETEIRIELLGWEDTLPGSGRPQALINADLDKADLFVGCLWQKMGSPSGVAGKTGFEEEFDRALARNHDTGTPEMWLFLKELDAVRAGDPGEALQKVLQFRKQQIEAKQLLFKEFKDVGSWRELIRRLLLRRLLQAVSSQQIGTKEEQASGNAPAQRQVPEAVTSAKESSTSKPEDTALAELLDLAAEGIRKNKLLVYDRTSPLPPASTARLLLFAATNYDWNAQHIEFGVHEINSIYLHRKSMKLTGHEILFALRTILLDSHQTKPGWYWVNQRKIPITGWLTYLATRDSDAAMRLAAVKLATRIAFPLGKGKKKTRSIKRILSDSDADVRIAGLNFLSVHGIASNKAEIETLLADTDKDVRTAAERSSRIFQLRHSPEAELLPILREKDTIDENLIEVLGKRKSDLTKNSLQEASLHHSGPLRSFAAQELLDRNELTKNSAIRFTTDESRRVRQIGYMFLALYGEAIDLDVLEEALQSSDYYLDEPSWATGDTKPVFSARLANMSDSDLWKKIITFDDQSALAVKVFGQRSKQNSADQLRKLINEGFDDAAAQAPKRSNSIKTSRLGLFSLLSPSDPIEAAKEEIQTAVLEILANDPTPEDRHLFLRHLAPDRSKRAQLLASLNGLKKVGTADDRPKVLPFLASNYNPVEKAASMTFLRLSPNPVSAASELLSAPTTIKVWAIVLQALETEDHAVWAILEPLLSNEDDDIRRIACYFALKTKSKKQISELLEAYFKRTTYYYNVVVIFDRNLYAPQSIADLYLEEELKWANQWG